MLSGPDVDAQLQGKVGVKVRQGTNGVSTNGVIAMYPC